MRNEPVGHNLVRHPDDCECGRCIGKPRYGPAMRNDTDTVRGGLTFCCVVAGPSGYEEKDEEGCLAALDRIESLLTAYQEVAEAAKRMRGPHSTRSEWVADKVALDKALACLVPSDEGRSSSDLVRVAASCPDSSLASRGEG